MGFESTYASLNELGCRSLKELAVPKWVKSTGTTNIMNWNWPFWEQKVECVAFVWPGFGSREDYKCDFCKMLPGASPMSDS